MNDRSAIAKEMKFARNILKMKGSSTLKAAQTATRLKEEGKDVIDLTVGEPDFDTPQFIKDYALEGLQKGITKYTPTAGLKTFKESISEYYSEVFGADVSPNEVAASCGGKQALFNAINTLVDEGEEVLIPKPYWVTFPEIVNFVGAENVFIDTEETDFVLTADQVRDAITPKTRLLIVNSPNNPTGRVIPPVEMRKIIETCAERGVYVITDECYLLFVYPPGEIFTAAVLPEELRKYVCIAGSFSKSFAMTGWRIGYTIAGEEWTKQMLKLQSHSASHPTSFVQYACARALQNSDAMGNAVGEMLAEYERRRDYLIPELQKIDGLKTEMPEGAFYAFVDVRDLLGDRFATSNDFAEGLLSSEFVVTTDGAGFGADGFVRISYATSMENLKRAVEKIAGFIDQ
ncbi:MAG: pyridoxal phosphate-dependent aminotransferase [Acidobacteria bacterium]|nr:MAG: pyridoxal phosphate-dependent aminotransferase [Acidobacteriota bacterium]REK02232.1 MAG: pyridoxal phosphate-dependent aminotransferase [Acidobacteriota bacterium]REK13965.1 MAG: pyridoxal phosphate-dependent aminotransferase [Acidobacteriota bacterium]REK41960.1 MAG: pyridoxal phosphate-dependent aminotransferase [Acidobacteriota bacterium]